VHTEVLVKVNAWVDEGVLQLVQALNQFDCLFTVDSCQGGDDKPAYVYFKYRGDDKLAELEFYNRLAQKLSERAAYCSEYEFRIEWCHGGERPLVYILVGTERINALAESLRAIASDCNVVCMDCGIPYGTLSLDFAMPHEQWELVSGRTDGSGILCANCMLKRASKIPGVTVAKIVLNMPSEV